MIEQPAAVNMILRPDGAGQVEAAQAAGDVNFDRKGSPAGLLTGEGKRLLTFFRSPLISTL